MKKKVLVKPPNSPALTTEADTSGIPSVPSCAKIGVAYSEDRDTARSLPNGAYLADAKMCQQLLGKSVPDGGSFVGILASCITLGACYLFKQLGKEEPDAKAISGPKACVSSADSKVAQDMPTLPPLAVITPTVKPVHWSQFVAIEGSADAVIFAYAYVHTEQDVCCLGCPVGRQRPGLHLTHPKVGLPRAEMIMRYLLGPSFRHARNQILCLQTLGAAPATATGGSNMMTNALAGWGHRAAVAALGIGGVAYYFIAGGKKSKSKKKSKRGVGVERAAEAMIVDEEAPTPAAPAPATGFEQYQGMMHPMGAQGPMTPVPQLLVQC
ncbi:unnamed protein product [Symbiodinium sp. CCMP2456]|nr:unnamed protein product [Symbiodinium sp. CCMP2456]